MIQLSKWKLPWKSLCQNERCEWATDRPPSQIVLDFLECLYILKVLGSAKVVDFDHIVSTVWVLRVPDWLSWNVEGVFLPRMPATLEMRRPFTTSFFFVSTFAAVFLQRHRSNLNETPERQRGGKNWQPCARSSFRMLDSLRLQRRVDLHHRCKTTTRRWMFWWMPSRSQDTRTRSGS